MNRSTQLSDERLLANIVRLESDIQDFEDRAGRQKAALEREGRFSDSEPLYQRLTSIRDHLSADLRSTQAELERRRRDRYLRPRWSLRSAVAALVGGRG